MTNNYTKFVKCTKLYYTELISKDSLTLYFCTNTHELFLGSEALNTATLEEIKALINRGRCISKWNCVTGEPYNAPELNYEYKEGDYYIVNDIISSGSIPVYKHTIILSGNCDEESNSYTVTFNIESIKDTEYTTIAEITAELISLGYIEHETLTATGEVTTPESTLTITGVAVDSIGASTILTLHDSLSSNIGNASTFINKADTLTVIKANYKPSGTKYTGKSTVIELSKININDYYLFNGTTWILVSNSKISDFNCGTITPTTTNFVPGTTYSILNSFQRSADLFEGLKGLIDTINSKIPNLASTTNQLADKAFVNSSIAANATNFRGSWTNWAAVPTDSSLYPEDRYGSRIPTNSDYLTIQDASDYGETYTGSWRFMYTGDWTEKGKTGWAPQYKIGSSFTAAQLAAIDSGITADKVITYDGYNTTIVALQTDKLTKDYTSGVKVYGHTSDGSSCMYTPGEHILFNSDKTISANYDNATTTTDGLMSSTDKTKLDGIDLSQYVTLEEYNTLKALVNTLKDHLNITEL